jgi:protein-tyrosine phosphatase
MLRNFSWVVARKLAGMGLPTGAYSDLYGGSARELEQDILALKNMGLAGVVSLTIEPLKPALLKRRGFDTLHLPVEDMTPPAREQITDFVDFVDRLCGRGGVVAHCSAGMGRTGVMLASYYVWTGSEWDQAIRQVRKQRPGSIETPEQEYSVYDFGEYTRQLKTR